MTKDSLLDDKYCTNAMSRVDEITKRKKTTRTHFVVDGFIYHSKVVSGKPPIRYLVCSEIKRLGCRARAILPVGADPELIKITKMHSHPPDENATIKDEFIKQLRSAAQSMPGSLKKVYETISLLYPEAAEEISFKSICSSLHRWRKKKEMPS